MATKKNKFESFDINQYVPKKSGLKYYAIKVLISLGKVLTILSVLATVVICVIFLINKLKPSLFPNFDSMYLAYGIMACAVSILIIVIGKVVEKFNKSDVVDKYKAYFESFNNLNPVSLQKEYQAFYYIKDNKLYLYQNLELFKEIDLNDIVDVKSDLNLIKMKPYKHEVLKKKIKKLPTLIGIQLTLKDETIVMIAINLLLKNASLDISTKKKSFLANNEFSKNALNTLVQAITINKEAEKTTEQKEAPKQEPNKEETTEQKEDNSEKKDVQEQTTQNQNNESAEDKKEENDSNDKKEDIENKEKTTDSQPTNIELSRENQEVPVKKTPIKEQEKEEVEPNKKVEQNVEEKKEVQPKKVYNFNKKKVENKSQSETQEKVSADTKEPSKVKEYNFNKKKTNTPAPNKTQEKEPAKEVKKDYPFQHKSSTHKKKELPFYLRQDNKK